MLQKYATKAAEALRNVRVLRASGESHTYVGQGVDRQKLRSLGLEVLGAGCYGVALRLPDGRVLKVSATLEDGTMLWIKEAHRQTVKYGMPKTKYMPRVDHFHHTGAYWWAVMEKVEAGFGAANINAEYIDRIGERWGQDSFGSDARGANCGQAADGRLVCFDPDGGVDNMTSHKIRAVQTKRKHGPEQRGARYH